MQDALEPDKKACGLRLMATRKALGFETARAFADITGVEEGTLTAWERGQNRIPLWYIRKLKTMFGITADWIYFNDMSGLQSAFVAKLIPRAS